MQSTFFLCGLFPPPATFAFVLIRAYRLGAGLAAQTHEALVVQGIVGHIEKPDGVPDFGRTRVGQWIHLNQPASYRSHAAVELDDRYLGTGRALIFPLSGYPRIEMREVFTQGRNLPDCATFFVTVLVKAEKAFGGYEAAHLIRIGRQRIET